MKPETWRRLGPGTIERNDSGGYNVVLHIDVIAACAVVAVLIWLVLR